jgi:hypothetical protein
MAKVKKEQLVSGKRGMELDICKGRGMDRDECDGDLVSIPRYSVVDIRISPMTKKEIQKMKEMEKKEEDYEDSYQEG